MDYTGLVDASKAYSDRYDSEVSENIDVFILMIESRVNRLLKTRKQSARLEIPTIDDTEFYDLPADYAGLRSIEYHSELRPNDYSVCHMSIVTPEQMAARRGEPFGGSYYYTIIGNQLQVFPMIATGAAIELIYYQKVPNLSDVDTTNWLSEDYPDIYLAGMMYEIETFVKNHDVADIWLKRLGSAVGELDTADVTERWSGSTLVTRLA